MKEELRDDFLITIFQLKNVINGKFSGSAGRRFSLNEIMILQGVRQGKTLGEIQDELSVSKSAISQCLTSLEKKETITRQIDLVDRRQVVITLTDLGQKEFKEAKVRFNKYFDDFIEEMTEENLYELLPLLNKMINILNNLSTGFSSDDGE